MIAVLPFVGKILEATKDSKSYRPSNPWVMAIMSLLAEIYGLDRLKLNLKFEIEMVFRTLGLQVRRLVTNDRSQKTNQSIHIKGEIC
jgi:CCR4-NOT transcription complex subunit 1